MTYSDDAAHWQHTFAYPVFPCGLISPMLRVSNIEVANFPQADSGPLVVNTASNKSESSPYIYAADT